MGLCRLLALLSAVLLGSACGPPRLGNDPSDSGSSTEGDATESSTSTGASTETGAPTTETDSETSGGPICGDGIVDPGEACDLGPDSAWELSDCQPDCTLNECGDGHVGPQECSWPYCLSDCPNPLLPCGNAILSCGDQIDNDRDTLVDLHDPDCLSPCDDSEDRLGFDQIAAGDPCKVDCFFDANHGAGDDHCEWNLQCDPQDPGALIGCAYDPDYAMLAPTCVEMLHPDCLDRCVPIVANGCDCFGCCEIAGQFRLLDDLWGDCSADNLEGCPTCTPNLSCSNPCEADSCEQCLLAELAPGCEQPSCPEGIESCTDPYGCPEGEFCQTGCCRPTSPDW
jgi:hypothetical protein